MNKYIQELEEVISTISQRAIIDSEKAKLNNNPYTCYRAGISSGAFEAVADLTKLISRWTKENNFE